MRPRSSHLLLLGYLVLTGGAGIRMAEALEPGVPQDGPSAYTLACVIEGSSGMPGMRACNELGAAQRCDHEADMPSKTSRDETQMTFINRSARALKIYWLSFSGARRLYQTIGPGDRVTQRTFIGHNWLVMTADGACVGIYNASPISIAFF